MKIEIEKVKNGYITILETSHGDEKRIHDTLQDALSSICEDTLMQLEGKTKSFKGDLYAEARLELLTH